MTKCDCLDLRPHLLSGYLIVNWSYSMTAATSLLSRSRMRSTRQRWPFWKRGDESARLIDVVERITGVGARIPLFMALPLCCQRHPRTRPAKGHHATTDRRLYRRIESPLSP